MNPASIRIRAMTLADVDAVMALAASLKHAPQWPTTAYRAALDPGAALPRIAFVAQDAVTGALAGFIVMSLTVPEAELESVAVAARFQRQGVARQLLHEAVEALRRVRVNRLILEVRSANDAARRLYASLGFLLAGRRPAYYSDPVDDAILMCRELV